MAAPNCYQIETLRDEEIVVLAKDGSPDAKECLYFRYRAMVERKARTYYLKGADRDDVVQEGMVGLCEAIRDFRPSRTPRFRPFAELCITRQIISAIKAAQSTKHVLLTDRVIATEDAGTTLEDQFPASDTVRPDHVLLSRWNHQRINQCVRTRLTPLERTVLKHHLTGEPYTEIARALQCNEKVVDNALQRVKRKLSSTLQQ